jgi:hypothetical protein
MFLLEEYETWLKTGISGFKSNNPIRLKQEMGFF